MTNGQIIEMAKRAGFSMENSAAIQAAERFAQLVRNEALEEAAVKCEEIDFSYSACEQFVSGEAAFECGKQIRSMKK